MFEERFDSDSGRLEQPQHSAPSYGSHELHGEGTFPAAKLPASGALKFDSGGLLLDSGGCMLDLPGLMLDGAGTIQLAGLPAADAALTVDSGKAEFDYSGSIVLPAGTIQLTGGDLTLWCHGTAAEIGDGNLLVASATVLEKEYRVVFIGADLVEAGRRVRRYLRRLVKSGSVDGCMAREANRRLRRRLRRGWNPGRLAVNDNGSFVRLVITPDGIAMFVRITTFSADGGEPASDECGAPAEEIQ